MPLTNAEKQNKYRERLRERFRAAEIREKESKRCKTEKGSEYGQRTKDEER